MPAEYDKFKELVGPVEQVTCPEILPPMCLGWIWL